MKQKSELGKAPAEQVLKDIWRQTCRQCFAEEKIRIVLEVPRSESAAVRLSGAASCERPASRRLQHRLQAA